MLFAVEKVIGRLSPSVLLVTNLSVLPTAISSALSASKNGKEQFFAKSTFTNVHILLSSLANINSNKFCNTKE